MKCLYRRREHYRPFYSRPALLGECFRPTMRVPGEVASRVRRDLASTPDPSAFPSNSLLQKVPPQKKSLTSPAGLVRPKPRRENLRRGRSGDNHSRRSAIVPPGALVKRDTIKDAFILGALLCTAPCSRVTTATRRTCCQVEARCLVGSAHGLKIIPASGLPKRVTIRRSVGRDCTGEIPPIADNLDVRR